MKILVIVRQVPDSTATIRLRGDHKDIERAGVKMVVNPFDEFAIELAVQLREKRADVENIVAVLAGPASAAEALRTALAVGCDEGLHLQDPAFEALDELQLAAVLAAVVREGGYDLILLGKQEIDLDSGQTGPALAELLDLPHIGATTAFELAADGRTFTARRRIEGAEEVVAVPLPALVTIDKGLVEMRYPSLPNLMKAKKKPVKVLTAADVPGCADLVARLGGTRVVTYEPPPERPPGKLLEGEADQQARALVQLLRDEAKVI
ncbi:MAG: electron transfer flavoprotein subunit beta/FixA family protein [Phycisphaerales bacterium]|nr:electron transfer flavoprotein subunit beta/FixA family protein [Phycisphaerales bacterium]